MQLQETHPGLGPFPLPVIGPLADAGVDGDTCDLAGALHRKIVVQCRDCQAGTTSCGIDERSQIRHLLPRDADELDELLDHLTHYRSVDVAAATGENPANERDDRVAGMRRQARVREDTTP